MCCWKNCRFGYLTPTRSDLHQKPLWVFFLYFAFYFFFFVVLIIYEHLRSWEHDHALTRTVHRYINFIYTRKSTIYRHFWPIFSHTSKVCAAPSFKNSPSPSLDISWFHCTRLRPCEINVRFTKIVRTPPLLHPHTWKNVRRTSILNDPLVILL